MKIRAIPILFFLLGLGAGLANCSVSEVHPPNDSAIVDSEADSRVKEENSLVIWWQQAFVSEGNEEIARLVREWEQSSGIKTTLQLKTESIDRQLESAIARGNSPDLVALFDLSEIIPKLAWEGELADVFDVIEPIRDSFNPGTLDSVNYLNNTTGQRSFYAIPTGMGTYNIHYWKPYLDRLGLDAGDIPRDWQGFWKFWQEVRDRLHQRGETDITSFCITLNKDSDDGPEAFLQFLHGHNANLFDRDGKLVIDRQENRQGLINALSQLADLYRDGYIHPGAMEWGNPDNNFQFLDRQCLLVTNGSLSIPATQKLPDTPYTQKEKNRYINEIVTLSPWPNTVNGNPFKVFVGPSWIVAPADSDRTETAKQFLAYLLQPKNLQRLTEQLKGRSLPPMPELLNTPFWMNSEDPHFAALRVISAGNIQPYPDTLNPAYAEVSKQRILTTALERVIRDNISPESAADEAIAQMQEIVGQYQE
ncbi:MAG: carbohydrate ABC transporter substrate-binding protein [Cyanobacteria bacterium SBLK]|nr:carbohydrate ABC transporter substrate-binding protein [Cyanobacteria bacterium SBLK]